MSKIMSKSTSKNYTAADRLNQVKMRLSELENEERKLHLRAADLTGNLEHFVPVPRLIVAGDFLTLFLTVGIIIYYFYIREYPDQLMLVTIFVGVFLTIMSFFYHRTYYLQKREKRRIERELKKINEMKTEIEKLIDAAQEI